MSDISLDFQHDLDLTDPLHTISLVTGEAAIQQQLRIRMQFFMGEWFLDTQTGIPFYRDILIKNPSAALIRDIFRRAILSTPGIVSVEDLTVDFNNSTRTASVAFRATLDTGEALIFEPFVVQV